MRKRKIPSRERTLGRWIRHTIRRNPWHDRAECVRIARLTFPRAPLRTVPDTFVIYLEPAERYSDGCYKPEFWVAVVLHRVPFARPYGKVPLDGSDRTVYVGLRSRAEALRKIEEHI